MAESNGDGNADRTARALEERVWRSEKVAMGVAREIVRSLAGLPPGEVLASEAAMVEQYGASRASIREALRLLEAQGLIVLRPGPGGGPILRGPDSASLGKTQTLFFHLLGAKYTDLLNVQLALEPMAAGTAAQNPDREQVQGLRAYIGLRLEDVADEESYTRRGFGFHRTLLAASGNPILSLLGNSISDILHARIGSHAYTRRNERQLMLDQHSEVARAVVAGNGKKAESAMKGHMEAYCAKISRDKGGLIDEVVDWH